MSLFLANQCSGSIGCQPRIWLRLQDAIRLSTSIAPISPHPFNKPLNYSRPCSLPLFLSHRRQSQCHQISCHSFPSLLSRRPRNFNSSLISIAIPHTASRSSQQYSSHQHLSIHCFDRRDTPDEEVEAAGSRANPDYGGSLHYARTFIWSFSLSFCTVFHISAFFKITDPSLKAWSISL